MSLPLVPRFPRSSSEGARRPPYLVWVVRQESDTELREAESFRAGSECALPSLPREIPYLPKLFTLQIPSKKILRTPSAPRCAETLEIHGEPSHTGDREQVVTLCGSSVLLCKTLQGGGYMTSYMLRYQTPRRCSADVSFPLPPRLLEGPAVSHFLSRSAAVPRQPVKTSISFLPPFLTHLFVSIHIQSGLKPHLIH